jgi:hypothetical protein
VIIPLDAEKTFDKMQHTFMIKHFHDKAVNKLGIQGNFLNSQGIYKNPQLTDTQC